MFPFFHNLAILFFSEIVTFMINWYSLLTNLTARCAVVRFCYHPYNYRPNWTPFSLITITYYEKFQINRCWTRVLIILKVLVSLSSARTLLRLISVCQEVIWSFRFRRAIFSRFNSIPARKPENMLELENQLSQW